MHDLFVELLQPLAAELLGRLVMCAEVEQLTRPQRVATDLWLRKIDGAEVYELDGYGCTVPGFLLRANEETAHE